MQADKKIEVLKDADLCVNSGEIVTIVGRSGVGKSTLLHIVGGLDAPSQGVVYIDGDDVYGLNNAKRSKLRNNKVGFVFQFYHLLPEFTALENVILPLMIKEPSFNQEILEGKALDVLQKVGLRERSSHKPNQLSGGEQQRVAIARALINDPKIIFCDEPTGNLDIQSGCEIIELLQELNQSLKQALVIVTHDNSFASFSHKTLELREGKLEKI